MSEHQRRQALTAGVIVTCHHLQLLLSRPREQPGVQNHLSFMGLMSSRSVGLVVFIWQISEAAATGCVYVIPFSNSGVHRRVCKKERRRETAASRSCTISCPARSILLPLIIHIVIRALIACMILPLFVTRQATDNEQPRPMPPNPDPYQIENASRNLASMLL